MLSNRIEWIMSVPRSLRVVLLSAIESLDLPLVDQWLIDGEDRLAAVVDATTLEAAEVRRLAARYGVAIVPQRRVVASTVCLRG